MVRELGLAGGAVGEGRDYVRSAGARTSRVHGQP